MPYTPRRTFRRVPYSARPRYNPTQRRTFARRPYARVLGGPTRPPVSSRSTLSLRRPYSDVSFLSDGSSNIAAAFYTNPTNQIVFLTATSGDIPTAVSSKQAGFACQWTVRDILDSVPVWDLFNQFQLRKLDIVFTMSNGSAFNATQANPIPMLAVCYDPNDSGLPADFETISTFENARTFQFGDSTPSFTYSIIPKAATLFYKTTLLQSYGTSNMTGSTWFDTTAGLDTVFYGLKGWFRNFPAAVTNGFSVRMQVKAHISVRCIQ